MDDLETKLLKKKRSWKRTLGRVVLALVVLSLILAAPIGLRYLKYVRPSDDLPIERLTTVQVDPRNRMPAGFSEKADEIVTRHMIEAGLPALSVAISRGDELLWSAAYGLADVEGQVPASLESRFRLASTSKAVTGVLIGRLLDQGQIDLDQAIGGYMPELPDHLRPLTLRQLASHTGGIRHYGPMDFNPYTWDPWTYGDGGLDIFKDDPLLFEPGKGFQYSTFGYTLLSRVLAAATGIGFVELLQEEVFSPAGMMSTGADRSELEIPDRVSFYSTGDGRFTRAAPHDVSYKWAGGGLLSSASDLLLLGRALLEDRLMSAEAREAIWRTVMMEDGSENPQRYGLGWRRDLLISTLGEDRPNLMMHHGGIQAGGCAFLGVLPEYDLVVAALTNTGAGEARGAVQVVSLDLIKLSLAPTPTSP